jgi:uncharacterized protein YcbK (DUF882 family)
VIRTLLVIAWLAPAFAHADHEQQSKKDREHTAKSANAKKLLAPGTKAEKLINVQNTWTDEWLAIAPGEKVSARTAARFLRDHYTNSPTKMEPRLLEIVASACSHFGTDTAFVVSAFRHPKYNLILRKKGRQVARDSQHTHGTAIDFWIPRVATLTLHAWAKAQQIGGVGLYLGSGFIHMDTGKVRYWNGE